MREERALKKVPLTCGWLLGKILNPSGRRQAVRRQPSKLIFVGSSPIARSSCLNFQNIKQPTIFTPQFIEGLMLL